jgi:hypothetical protein
MNPSRHIKDPETVKFLTRMLKLFLDRGDNPQLPLREMEVPGKAKVGPTVRQKGLKRVTLKEKAPSVVLPQATPYSHTTATTTTR